jgi:hypothetical protein
MAIDTNDSRAALDPEKCEAVFRKDHAQINSLLVARHAAKYSRQKQKRGPEARVG